MSSVDRSQRSKFYVENTQQGVRLYDSHCQFPDDAHSIAWSVITSLKSNENVFTHSAFWLQFPPDFSAYKEIWNRIPLLKYTANTLKVAVIVTFGQLFYFFVGWLCFCKNEIPRQDKLFVIYLATMMVPGVVLLIPNFVIMRTIGAIDTHWALICQPLEVCMGLF
jgi:multiple sugar transport system permease protein